MRLVFILDKREFVVIVVRLSREMLMIE
jgi:hypothetical protein